MSTLGSWEKLQTFSVLFRGAGRRAVQSEYPSKVRSFRISVVPGGASDSPLGFLGFHNGTLPVDSG